jgi:hypothetical protein
MVQLAIHCPEYPAVDIDGMAPSVAFERLVNAGWPKKLAIARLPLKLDWEKIWQNFEDNGDAEMFDFWWTGLKMVIYLKRSDGNIYSDKYLIYQWDEDEQCSPETDKKIIKAIKGFLWNTLLLSENLPSK